MKSYLFPFVIFYFNSVALANPLNPFINDVLLTKKSVQTCNIFTNKFDLKLRTGSIKTFPNGKVEKDHSVHLGTETKRGDYPHIAALGWRHTDRKIVFKCVGSIISERFVLTAAHCFQGRSKPSIIRVGDSKLWDKENDAVNNTTKDYTIESLIKHKRYSSKTKQNDIGLVKVSEEIAFDNFVLPSCLQESDDFGPNDYAVGWIKNPHSNETAQLLRRKDLVILRNAECLEKLSGQLSLKEIFDGQLCAINVINDENCRGESGDVLQAMRPRMKYEEFHNRTEYNETIEYSIMPRIYHIVGVASYGPVCGSIIYTKISSYLDWIEKLVWQNSSLN